MNEAPALLDTTEAAKYLGLSVSTLNKWRLIGEGPAWRKVGPVCVRYSTDDITAWLDSRVRHATRDAA